jgi:hypothetical protein
MLQHILQPHSNKRLIVFGTGELARTVTEWAKPFVIDYYVDNNQQQWETTFLDRPVQAPDVLRAEPRGEILVLIASSFAGEISAQLQTMGLQPLADTVDCNYLSYIAPGLFYSPLPAIADVRAQSERIFSAGEPHLPGIDLSVSSQLQHLHAFATYRALFPYRNEPNRSEAADGLRYYLHNNYFGYADSFILFAMLNMYRPRRIIEVGSGFSSAVMLDTNEYFLDRSVSLTFIEPYPARLQSLLRNEDNERASILVQPVQQVPLERFSELQEDDILFIDSSHVGKIGSDVNWLFAEVLPRLNAGVIVHFHDIFYPFEYPERWVYEGRAWNEAYMLRTFLQHNDAYSILYWNSYLTLHRASDLERKLPECKGGGSIWLKKTKSTFGGS